MLLKLGLYKRGAYTTALVVLHSTVPIFTEVTSSAEILQDGIAGLLGKNFYFARIGV